MSIRVKSLLTPFYKLAHPDVLRQAPENVQKANTMALTTLNSYIDSINQGLGVSLSSIRFYVPRKNNFTECKVTLLPLKPNSSNTAKNTHLETVVNSINQAISNPEETLEESEEFIPSKRLRIKDEYWNSMTGFIQNYHASEHRKEAREHALKNAANIIEGEYNPFHPSKLGLATRKTNRFVQMALESSIASPLFKKLQENFQYLDKLFIDNDLEEEKVTEGLKNLSCEGMSHDDKIIMREIYSSLYKDSIPLFISSRYSVMNVPGYFQIPFNFKTNDASNFLRNNSSLVKERLLDYSGFANKTGKIMKYISEVSLPCTLARYLWKNHEVYETQSFAQAYVAAKKILDMIEKSKFPRGIEDAILVIGLEYKAKDGFLQVPMNFVETELFAFLEKNRQKK
ncbi:hypothetical protein SteCoe_25033 [Stentor coeruleus]|uniref:DUF4460 domain-containing protein n=1 Tax=Stentor coeruleus TaxID=5963 RepID=A0A1R2BG59_9CILI|nr:hypothetical protein SteCoe_25033 [Stentor coeruleus]